MRRIVYAACGVTLMIGLFFVFVWAPHPWGWEGFDHYHQLALVLAHGGGFPTLDVPWGYAGFLAAFYRLFGDHPAIPLLAQVALNSCVPLLVFVAAREWFDARVATVAALLAGLCSFNTVYASTQSSDAVCTVLFMLAIVAFIAARRDNRWPMAHRCKSMAPSQFSKRADNTSSMCRFFSHAESDCYRQNLKRSNASSKPKACSHWNANGSCRSFRGASEL